MRAMHDLAGGDGSTAGVIAVPDATLNSLEPTLGVASVELAPLQPASSYRGSSPSPGALGAIVLFHAAAAAMLVTVQLQPRDRPNEEGLAIFSIDADQPPPAEPAEPVRRASVAAAQSPVAPVTPPLALARPLELAAPPPSQVTIEPAPAAVAPSTAVPVPVPAAPAPVTPPDFSARQLNNPAPAYPYLSRRAREEGVVLLRVLVSEGGQARQLEVEQSSGHERLDEAALKTVRGWRFVPATQGGVPREAWVLVPVTFDLG